MSTQEVLRVRHLSISDQGDGGNMGTCQPCQRLLHDVNITLNRGQILVIMGKSGVGKSVSMMSLLAIQDPRFVVSGEVFFCGQRLPIHEPHARTWRDVRGCGIAYLFQDAKQVLNPLDTIKTAFDKVFSHTRLSKNARQKTMITLLQKTQVYHPSLPHRYPHELSGGEAKRVHLALLLALDSTLIIADEPTGHLEDELKQSMLALLADLSKNEGKAVIIISHDERALAYANQVMMMADGSCHEVHDKTALYGRLTQKFDNRAAALPSKLPSELPTKPPKETPVQLPSYQSDDKPLLLSIKGLRYHYRSFGLFWGSSRSINQARHFGMSVPDFDIKQGQIVGLMGRSGVGKSTLAKLITRLDDAIVASGEILFADEGRTREVLCLDGRALLAYRPNVVLMMQDYMGSLNPYLTIHQSVAEGLIAKHRRQKTHVVHEEMHHSITELLTELNLPTDILQKYPHQLSGGQRARVCLVRALLVRPKLLILDEPTAMLDDDNTWQMMNMIKDINKSFGVSMLIISHDGDVLAWLCDKVIEMKKSPE